MRTPLAILARLVAPTLAAAALLSGSARAQNVGVTVGPEICPPGCDVQITLSNDNPFVFGFSAPLFQVRDDQGQLVFDSNGPALSALVGPFGWFTYTWDQRDSNGDLVPPGDYTLFVQPDFGFTPVARPLTIGGTGAGVVLHGTGTTQETFGGDTRDFFLCAPDDPGEIYALFASLASTTGIPTCGGTLPLDPDALFLLSLTPNAVFPASIGFLDGAGTSFAPQLDLPPNPNLVGIDIYAAFAVLNATEPCPVRRVSNAHKIEILT